MKATPVFVDGILYVTTPFGRLLAIDGATGRERWAFDPKVSREIAAVVRDAEVDGGEEEKGEVRGPVQPSRVLTY